MHVLFETVHGSRLYGLAHRSSDYDTFTVVDKVPTKRKKYAKQTIVDNQDITVVDFGTFVNGCVSGVPQYLEACFSTQATKDTIGAWRHSFVATTGCWDKYYRTIRSFAHTDDFKHKRHALRLAMNLRVMRRYGRFDPTLDDMQIMCVNKWADNSCEAVYDIAKDIAWEVY